MRRAESRAVVAVKVFVERNEVAPVRIVLKALDAAEHRAPPVVSHEDAE